MSDRESEVGALWARVSKTGRRYMTGKINGQEVVVFENEHKTGKAPDYRVYKSQPRDTSQRETRPRAQSNERDDTIPF